MRAWKQITVGLTMLGLIGACADQTANTATPLDPTSSPAVATIETSPSVGACANLDGSCAVTDESECQATGGQFVVGATCALPDGSATFPGAPGALPAPEELEPIDLTGACCLPQGGCSDLTAKQCFVSNGNFFAGTLCKNTDACQPIDGGACCMPFGKCAFTNAQQCSISGGSWFQGQQCSAKLCGTVVFAEVGACCLPDGSCEELSKCQCEEAGGQFLNGLQCIMDATGVKMCPLTKMGACCLPIGTCELMTAEQCQLAQGQYNDGKTCDEVDCAPQLDACCVPNGDCLEIPTSLCKASAGIPHPGLSCEEIDGCPQTIWACCMPDGNCEQLTKKDCLASGGLYHYGANCEEVDCPIVGACCLPDGQCIETSDIECTAAGGSFNADGNCDTTQCCTVPTVAPCCVQGACYAVTTDMCFLLKGKTYPTNMSCDQVDCCGGTTISCEDGVGVGENKPFDPTNATGLGLNGGGALVLDANTLEDLLLYVANSPQNTVSKFDTVTGKELGRYAVCANPSRTSVDLDNACWVGCRNDGKIAKIIHEQTNCIDANSNGTIETSKDINNDGIISGGEILPFGADECVVVFNIGGAAIRAAGVDSANHPWFGDSTFSWLKRIHPTTGAVEQTIQLPTAPYGLAIDSTGIIWVSSRAGYRLLRVDPTTSTVTSHTPPSNPSNYDPYGIAIDKFGKVWTGATYLNKAFRYDPVTSTWASVATNSRPRGVAADGNGNVLVALDMTSMVAKINATTMTVDANYSLGANRFPVGVAVDADGYVWAVNQTSSTASKVDLFAPPLTPVILEVSTGANPYTYSDMTGYALKTVVAVEGTYTATFEGCVDVDTNWFDINVAYGAPPDTHIEVRYRVANDLTSLLAAPWSPTFGPFPPATMPIDLTTGAPVVGKLFQVQVKLVGGPNGASPVVSGIHVTSGL